MSYFKIIWIWQLFSLTFSNFMQNKVTGRKYFNLTKSDLRQFCLLLFDKVFWHFPQIAYVQLSSYSGKGLVCENNEKFNILRNITFIKHSCFICEHIGSEIELQDNLNRTHFFSRPFQCGAILGMFLYVNTVYITK